MSNPYPPQLLINYWEAYLENSAEKTREAVEACFSKDVVFVHNNKVLNYEQTLQGSLASLEVFEFVSTSHEALGSYDCLPVNYVWYGRLFAESVNRENGSIVKADARFTAIFGPRDNGTQLFYIQLSPNESVIPPSSS